jgi:hypothetical protein
MNISFKQKEDKYILQFNRIIEDSNYFKDDTPIGENTASWYEIIYNKNRRI